VTSTRSLARSSTALHRLDLLANPLAPSLRVYEALSSEFQLRRPAGLLRRALIERLAASEAVPVEWIAVGAGIDDLLVAILRAFGRPDNLVLFPPTDDAVACHAARLGMSPVLVPRSTQFTIDLERSGLPAFPPNSLTVIQHPNDPTGTPLTVHDAVRLIRRSRVVVIDERHAAYGARSLLPLVREFDRILILRTFETWAGLGAFPIAYAVGSPDLIQAIERERMVPVPTGSLLAAHASLDDERGLRHSVARIREEKARLYRMLRKLNMVRPMPSWANFVLVRTERGDTSRYPEELLRRDIRVLVPEQPEVAGYFRISALSHEATAALRAALIEIGQII
jgi:histidinol-phosphate aminotransferase